jgi:hypothetical protein
LLLEGAAAILTIGLLRDPQLVSTWPRKFLYCVYSSAIS